MKVSVSGKSKHISTKEIKELAHFCAKWLIKRRRSLESTLKIIFSDIEDQGLCSALSTKRGFPRHFRITLRKNMFFPDLVWVFMHEMMHVQQYSDGRIKNNEVFYFRGKAYEQTSAKSLKDHKNLPWEKEADLGAELLLGKLHPKYKKEMAKGILDVPQNKRKA